MISKKLFKAQISRIYLISYYILTMGQFQIHTVPTLYRQMRRQSFKVWSTLASKRKQSKGKSLAHAMSDIPLICIYSKIDRQQTFEFKRYGTDGSFVFSQLYETNVGQ